MNVRQFIAFQGTEPKSILVDDCDYTRVMEIPWHINQKGYVVYSPDGGETYLRLHNFVLGLPNSSGVDHLDRNKLNNCRFNLRIVANSIQGQNRNIFKNNTSGYTGVSGRQRRNKYVYCAYIKVNYKQITLGDFPTAEAAARAYNKAAITYFGKDAKLNEVEETQ